MTEIDKIIERLMTDGRKFGICLNPPASDSDILKFETVTEMQLPSDIKEFYKKCNGFDADDDWLFRVIPLKDIAEERGGLPKNRLHFAEYMIYSDSWIIELRDREKYALINSNHGTEDEVILCDSIVTFLNRYLKSDGVTKENGLYKWFDEIKLSGKNFTQQNV